jgi:hypothetical protein
VVTGRGKRARVRGRAAWIGCALTWAAPVSCACDVADHARDTGGIDLDSGASAERTDCARGFVVVGTDYASTNVSLLDLDGGVLSASFISSGSAAPGLSLALGGDVTLPTQRINGSEIVLLDRHPASVLTWVDLAAAQVTRQLSVATGFASNPHDYSALSATRAYVPRFDANPAPGQQQFDQGNDVLVIDPLEPEITGRIDLSAAMDGAESRFLPRAERSVLVRDRLYVLLGAASSDLLETTDSRLAVLATEDDSIRDVLVFEGLHGCSALALAPQSDELAVGCSGSWGGDNEAEISESALVRVAIQSGVQEVARYAAGHFGQGPIAQGVAYATERLVLLTTYGRFSTPDQPAADDTLIELDLETGDARVLLRSAETPFSLGAVSCDAACAVCLVADAERQGGVVHRFEVTPEGVTGRRTIKVETSIGLPPRQLGQF